jgi:hypothetical protein
MLTPTPLHTTVGHTHADSYTLIHYSRSHMLTPTIFYNTVGHTHPNFFDLIHYSRSHTHANSYNLIH